MAKEGTQTRSGEMPVLELAQIWKFLAVLGPHLQLLSARQLSNLSFFLPITIASSSKQVACRLAS